MSVRARGPAVEQPSPFQNLAEQHGTQKYLSCLFLKVLINYHITDIHIYIHRAHNQLGSFPLILGFV